MARKVRLALGRMLGALSIVVGLSAVGFAQLSQQHLDAQQQAVIERVEHEADLRVATQCVASWERIKQIRDGDEKAYRRNADTLIELSQASAASSPDRDERIAQYRELVERDVAEIRAANDDPACDLEAAQELLDEEGTSGT